MIHLLVRLDDSLLRGISLNSLRRLIVLICILDALGEGHDLIRNGLIRVSERKLNSGGWAADFPIGKRVDSVYLLHKRIVVVGLLREGLIGGVDIGDAGSSTDNGD